MHVRVDAHDRQQAACLQLQLQFSEEAQTSRQYGYAATVFVAV